MAEVKPKCPACKKEWCTKPWCDGTPYPQDILNTEARLPHLTVITIGDFSGDGHQKTQDFYIRSNKTRDELREAWFAAKNIVPEELWPSTLCSEYEDCKMSPDTITQLQALGAPLPENPLWVTEEDMFKLTLWFLKQGDNEAHFEHIEAPSLMFCGPDAKGRFSESIGYGCSGG